MKPAVHPTSEHDSENAPLLAYDASSGLRVVEGNPQFDRRWEALVIAHPNATIYHHPGWLRALQEEYGQEGAHLSCETRDGRLLAVLPMFYTRGLPFDIGRQVTRRRLSSLPRTPLGGPLSIDPDATYLLLQAAVDLSRRPPGAQLQLKTQSTKIDGLGSGVVRSPWRSSYIVELSENPDDLRFQDKEARRQIKKAVNKATRLGVQIRAAESESELRSWYCIYLETMRRNMVPPRPYRFFRALWSLLGAKGVMQLLLAERINGGQRTLLAGSITLMNSQTVSYAFTGCKKEDFICRPNDLILWHAINDACRRGFRWFDLGEVPEEHESLIRFKTKWGAVAAPLYRYYYPALDTSKSAISPVVSRARHVLGAVWQRLPLRATALLGDWIYSRL